MRIGMMMIVITPTANRTASLFFRGKGKIKLFSFETLEEGETIYKPQCRHHHRLDS